MRGLTSCFAVGVFFALGAVGAASGQVTARLNVHDYKDAASLREAMRQAVMPVRGRSPHSRGAAAPSPGALPSIISGKILTDQLLTATVPGVPRTLVSFDAPNGLSDLTLYFTYPTGQLQVSTYSPAAPGTRSGTLVIEQGLPSWGSYVASGEWKLTNASITDSQGGQTAYSAEQLSALFPSLSLQVKNDISPDDTPPSVTGGQILTPVVKASGPSPVFKARMSVADDLSGVAQIVLWIEDSNGTIDGEYTYPPSPVMKGAVLVKNDFFGAPSPGVWTIYAYQVCDVPNNCLLDDSPADIKALFGTNSFTVVQ